MEPITHPAGQSLRCTHCGDPCPSEKLNIGDKPFCCEGCRLVYQLLDTNGLCNYYNLNQHPGLNRRIAVRTDKFAFLDDEKIAAGLITFRNDEETHITFYLPAIHCSSCLYLLEHLRRLDPGVLSSRVDFAAKEVSIVFDQRRITLRHVAQLLTSLGYEPYISLNDIGNTRPGANRALIYRLGVAGFCFGNIMLLCFPEYLGLDANDITLRQAFRYISFILALPVFFYSAQPFYQSAWSGLRNKYLNIDAPIVLAIGVTFGRSLWEVLSGSGSGFFDSMSGIVFFMLAGRVLQDRTYRQLSFERDYTAYFPVAVTVLKETTETVSSLPDIRCGDTLRIHSGELIPADGILTRGRAFIDYSFVTGESLPVTKTVGEIVYAGGRQTGAAIEVLVVKEVAQSYLTQLWNRQGDRSQEKAAFSFVDTLSRNFTGIVLLIAMAAAVYWQLHDPAHTWKAVTAVLIVACPCALLLSTTFTNGNLLRLLGRSQCYLRNAGVLEKITRATHIVFDKTGTLTDAADPVLTYTGIPLSRLQQDAIGALAAQSAHPLSRALARQFRSPVAHPLIHQYWEYPGKGIEAFVDGHHYTIGSATFVKAQTSNIPGADPRPGAQVFIVCDNRLLGSCTISGHYRDGMSELARRLSASYRISVLSGDNNREARQLRQLLGEDTTLLFDQSPLDKCRYISRLHEIGEKVIMLGDGLNDAGALRESDVGIAIAADTNLFTPASDAILQASQLHRLPDFIRLCKAGRNIILGSFILSAIYNVIGLFFAVHASLSPLLAAVLMPASTLSILLVTYGASNWLGRRWLRRTHEEDQETH